MNLGPGSLRGSLNSEKFPVFSLLNWDEPAETSLLGTRSTATQSQGVETSRKDPRMDPEKLAKSRGVGG